MSFEHFEHWVVVIKAFVRLGATDEWTSRSEVDQELVGEIEDSKITLIVDRLLRAGVIRDDGGIGRDRYFMLTDKAWDYLEEDELTY